MVLVIGLDGATFDLLEPWLAAGHLPTLARLVAQGSSGPLQSTLPPVTAPAWATFMTGKNPGKHNVFDFFRAHSPDLDRPEMVNMGDVQARPFWDYLSAAGRRVGILNVPLTYPPTPVNGFIVPGLLSPDEGQTTYPADFLRPYHPTLGPYRLVPHRLYRPEQTAAFVAELQAVTATQIQYALRMAQDHPVDFLMVHFLATDIAQHKLWRYLDETHPWYEPVSGQQFGTAVRDIFAQIDAGLSQLLTILPSDLTMLVMSDHGFGPQQQIMNLNILLIEAGFMRLKPEAAVKWRDWLARHKWWANPAARLFRLLGRERLLSFADVDWAQTQAYARGHMGQVYLNVQGREPQGIVSPADYTAVREQIAALLTSWRHPADGRIPVTAVIPGEAAASGPYATAGPDLHVIIDGYRTLAHPLFAADGRILTAQPWGDSGSHRREGVLIVQGPEVRHGRIANARLEDIAPTILHLLGVPVAEDMDGRVLTTLFTDAFQRHPVTYQSPLEINDSPGGLTAAMQATVEEHLRGLGYLG